MIYFLRRTDGAIKIGTTENYYARLSTLTTEHGNLELLGWMEGSFQEERQIHGLFATYHVDHTKGEWFTQTPELLTYIQQNTHVDSPPRVSKTGVIRLEEKSMRAIYMLAGEKQSETGKSVSVNDTIWNFIKAHRPDIATRADTIK